LVAPRQIEIRAYVEATLLRAAEMAAARAELDSWAAWARQEADRIEPVKNGISRSYANRGSNPLDN
jgi:hypothetical protein